MAYTQLTKEQAQQMAQRGDKFVWINGEDGQSIGAAHIPLAQAVELEQALGYTPENLTFSNGRVLANGQDITQFVDTTSYLPHSQTNQVSGDSILQTALKFGAAGLGAYGVASGLGALTNALAPAATSSLGEASMADLWNGMPSGTTEWNGMIPSSVTPVIPPITPTGTEADWYNMPDGTPAPSGSTIAPNGTIYPPGTPIPPGTQTVPLAPGPNNPLPPGYSLPSDIPPTTPAPVPTPSTVPAPTSTKIGGDTDWGKVIAGILGAYGSDQMAKEYRATADKYMAMGAPSRDRYEASFAPGFTMMNDPGYKDALDSVGKESAAAMSMHGNPADSPNAWKQTQLDVYNKVAYPALQGYRQTNASAGGLASFASAVPAADTAATGAQQNIWNAGGSIASNLFSPPSQQTQLNDAMIAYFKKQAGLG